MKGKLKNPHLATQSSGLGRIKPKIEDISITDHKHPIFCFKFIHRDYALDQCSVEEKVAFIEQIVRLSQLTWQQIQQAPRHGMGSEKIAVSSLNTKCTDIVTEDVTFLLAFRFLGKMPFVGFRNKFLLHIIFIDRNHKVY